MTARARRPVTDTWAPTPLERACLQAVRAAEPGPLYAWSLGAGDIDSRLVNRLAKAGLLAVRPGWDARLTDEGRAVLDAPVVAPFALPDTWRSFLQAARKGEAMTHDPKLDPLARRMLGGGLVRIEGVRYVLTAAGAALEVSS